MRIIRKNRNFSKKNFSDREEIWDFIVNKGIATDDEVRLVIDINGYSESSLNDIIYARTGFRSMEQYLGDDDEEEDAEDFACGSKSKKKFADLSRDEKLKLWEKQGKLYMDTATGSVDTHDGWWYEDEDGEQVNAVETGEVTEVYKDENGAWQSVWDVEFVQ